MKNKKLVCFGNSVGIRIRPGSSESRNYVMLLNEHDNLCVDNYCFTGNMIESVSQNTDLILQKNADVVILQFGIVELCSRSTSRSIYDYLNYTVKRKPSGQFIQRIGLFLESKLRTPLVHLRFKSSWYHPNRFAAELEKTLQSICSNSSAHVICLGVNTPSQRIEKQLPGSMNRVGKIHGVMQSICSKWEQCTYIDVTDIQPELIPDGIHYSEEGHKVIYERILKQLTN